MGALSEFGGYSAENSLCTKTVYKYISEGLMETMTTGLPSKLKRKPSNKGQTNVKIKRSLAKTSRKGRKRQKAGRHPATGKAALRSARNMKVFWGLNGI